MADVEYKARNSVSPITAGLNWLLVILLILMAAYVVIVTRGQAGGRSSLLNPGAEEKPVVARGDLADDEKATIEIFRKASPSVVNITSLAIRRNELSLDTTLIPRGTGSGVVWDQDGYIVTNNHVIEEAGAARVTLADHSEWDARLVGVAEDKDLAVLKIEAGADRLHPIALGTSADLQVGQKVFAIGNPFGLDQTLTTGVVSQIGRELLSNNGLPIQGVIQTNASINPGNSGGPLLDSAGLMIGINTAIYSASGVNAGIGFAVPVDTVRWIVPQLIRHGEVEPIGMGVRFLGDQIAEHYGLHGVLVLNVSPGSPAAEAGIVPTRLDDQKRPIWGDLIVAINDQPMQNSLDVYRALDQFKAGDTVTVTVQRGEALKKIPVTLRAIKTKK